MNLITGNKPFSYKASENINVHENSRKNNESSQENSNTTITNVVDNSTISEDAKIGYAFLNSIENSVKDTEKTSFIDKYTAEYEKIKKDIESGKYGNDFNKYKNMLDDAFKNAIEHVFKLTAKEALDSINSTSNTLNKKLPLPELKKCQKQYETATTFVWMFRAENKRILQEIEYYRKKKNHRMVTSLTQLSDSYKHAINNIFADATFIQSKINDSFSADSNTSQNPSTELDKQS